MSEARWAGEELAARINRAALVPRAAALKDVIFAALLFELPLHAREALESEILDLADHAIGLGRRGVPVDITEQHALSVVSNIGSWLKPEDMSRLVEELKP